MKKVRVGELKNNLSRYLDHVRAGGTVIVLHRDRAVAKIVPMGTDAGLEDDDARIAALERHGLARRGKDGMRAWLKTHRPIKVVRFRGQFSPAAPVRRGARRGGRAVADREFVTLDDRQVEAAGREGCRVLGPR